MSAKGGTCTPVVLTDVWSTATCDCYSATLADLHYIISLMIMEPSIRLELMTCCLQNSCSTTELRRRICHFIKPKELGQAFVSCNCYFFLCHSREGGNLALPCSYTLYFLEIMFLDFDGAGSPYPKGICDLREDDKELNKQISLE